LAKFWSGLGTIFLSCRIIRIYGVSGSGLEEVTWLIVSWKPLIRLNICSSRNTSLDICHCTKVLGMNSY
jgi:hypothetical protein